jgi:hypothetical protein
MNYSWGQSDSSTLELIVFVICNNSFTPYKIDGDFFFFAKRELKCTMTGLSTVARQTFRKSINIDICERTDKQLCPRFFGEQVTPRGSVISDGCEITRVGTHRNVYCFGEMHLMKLCTMST